MTEYNVNDNNRGRGPYVEDEEVSRVLNRDRNRRQQEQFTFSFNMKPTDVKAYLDRYVIGQDRAKKILSNGICYHFVRISKDIELENLAQAAETVRNNRNNTNPPQRNTPEYADWERQMHNDTNANTTPGYTPGNTTNPQNPTTQTPKGNGHIKKNILLIGNTGVGKTYLVNKLSQLVGVPFVKADMTKFSATGYVGGDVEDVIRDLYIKADKKKRLAEIGMVYLDEFDKIASYASAVGKDVNGLEVQRSLLKLLEETEVAMTGSKNAMPQQGAAPDNSKINTKNVLFICSGAFPGLGDNITRRLSLTEGQNWRDHIIAQDLVDYGMEAELIGRIPVRAALNDLSSRDLYRILKESEDSVVPKYQRDLSEFGVNLTFTDEALALIADKASESKTGARALVGVIEDTLTDFMYELPSTDIKELEVNAELFRDPTAYLNRMLANRTQTPTTQ